MRAITRRTCAMAALLMLGLGARAETPGFRLGDAARPLAYQWRLAIDPRETTFAGEVRIEIDVQRAMPTLWLNATGLDVDAVELRQEGRALAAAARRSGEEHVGIDVRDGGLAPGRAQLVLRYHGPLDSVSTQGLFRQSEGGEWYVVSQFEAVSARRALPCFDEPHWKTPWRITIETPAGNEVSSNAPETLVSDVPGRTGWKRHDFAATRPLPTYLVALAVGPFDVVDGGTAGMRKTPLRYFAPKGRGAEMRYVREATPRIVELEEEYFGRPYPFEKLDQVVIPQAVGFGAMENAGMITYAGNIMLATPREETPRFRRGYVGTAAHEIAHMWFGDMVTLAWWDDLWLNESFATWIEQKITPRFDSKWDNGTSAGASRVRSIGADRLASAHRIRTSIVEKTDLEGAFDGIVYQKGAAVLSMFERWFGPERFRAGVRAFLAQHEYGNATADDFVAALGEAAGQGRAALAVFRSFIEQPGVPMVDMSLQCSSTAAVVETRMMRMRPVGSAAGEMRWTTPACFTFPRDGTLATQCTELANGASRVELPPGRCPEWVMGNADGRSYYLPRYDAPLSKELRQHIDALPVNGIVALLVDLGFLAEGGLAPIAEALAWSDAALGHASPIVKQYAVELLEKMRDPWLTPALARAKADIVARRVIPLARELGWLEHAAEGDDARLLRATLLPFAAEREEGASLRAEARRLALAWITDREAVPASMTRAVLETAGRFADDATYEKLEARALAADDTRERGYLLSALAKARDPKLRARALALANDDRVRPRDALGFVENALDDDYNRRVALDYVNEHYEALSRKLPYHAITRFLTPAGKLCTPADRDAFVTTFAQKVGKLEGGEARYRHGLETIELCVAARGPRP